MIFLKAALMWMSCQITPILLVTTRVAGGNTSTTSRDTIFKRFCLILQGDAAHLFCITKVFSWEIFITSAEKHQATFTTCHRVQWNSQERFGNFCIYPHKMGLWYPAYYVKSLTVRFAYYGPFIAQWKHWKETNDKLMSSEAHWDNTNLLVWHPSYSKETVKSLC